MTTPLSHPERVAIARLHAMLELLPTALDKRLGAAGVTAFEHTLLDALTDRDSGRMRLSELAAKTNATLPRISRVATSLEKRGLIERAPCPEDGRATNAVLTELGAATHESSREIYADAVRELVLEGLGRLPGDGVSQLSELTFAVLTSLDPDHPRGDAAPACNADGDSGAANAATNGAICIADSAPTCSADPAPETSATCAADPAPAKEAICAADPA